MITDEQHAALLAQFNRLGVDVVRLGKAANHPEIVFEGWDDGVHVAAGWPEEAVADVIRALAACTDKREVWFCIRKVLEKRGG